MSAIPFQFHCFLPLYPRILKNSKKLVSIPIKGTDKRRMIPISSDLAREFMSAARKAIEAIPGKPTQPYQGSVTVRMFFYGPWELNEAMPDLSNLYQAIEDVLQDTGILVNDRQIMSHDGSRRVPLCSFCQERELITRGERKGQRKDSCGHKRSCQWVGIDVLVTAREDDTLSALATERMESRSVTMDL